MASYNDKLIDSLATRIQLFLFWKSFYKEVIKTEDIANYIDEIEQFKIDNDLANLYSNTYYQTKLKEKREILFNGKNAYVDNICKNIPSKTKIKELLRNELKPLKDKYKEKFGKIFPLKEFEKMTKDETCSYCGISLAQIEELGKKGKLNNKRSDTRGYTLEIDRMLPNLEYSKKNCCMACYWCNNAKTDEFSPEEFKPIAEGIRKTWNERLKAIGYSEEEIKDVPDPEIWNTKFDTSMEPDIEK
ncbi:hypothetical protein [Campylobacter concisus]|jgi:hypothetical protein|uniref:hypothetical protein n=1 Tax=Campylobacter concisus TaxID=199 RepID=UPI0011E72F10|nr:hypothetical protein [Campylobacter concisus]